MTSPQDNFSEPPAISDRPHARVSSPHTGEHPRLQPGSEQNAHRALALPAFITAAIYLVFGLSTVFVQEPTLGTLKILTGVFLLTLGLAQVFTAQKVRFFDAAVGQSLTSTGLVLAGAAALLLLTAHSEFIFIVIVALALGIASILKVLLGMRTKHLFDLGKDWQLEGLIMTISAVGLVVIGEIGDKAILGTLGGGAIIAGVFLLIGAITLGSHHPKAPKTTHN